VQDLDRRLQKKEGERKNSCQNSFSETKLGPLFTSMTVGKDTFGVARKLEKFGGLAYGPEKAEVTPKRA